ncbi:MAG: cation diffusion facilitator family transporter [Nitrospinaceae bacterium]|nr:cation diffusion facilitator family transporter [Nitrospinaceae bacterium]
MASPTKMNPGIKATLVGAAANFFLAIIKFFGGVVGNSTAMVADAVHSISDLMTDAIVLFTYKVGQKPRDADHPYGHGRAETLGSTVVGLLIIAAGIGLAYEAWNIIEEGSTKTPNAIAAGVAVLSILSNEWLFRYTRSVGKKTNSPTIVANAWHHRSDSISSIAALAGIVGAMSGFPMLDPIAAVMVALMVMKVGYEITLGGFRDLMDTALGEKQTLEIQAIIENISGVIKSHDLRTRRIGGEVLMDVHIQVRCDLTVTEGHEVAERVRRKLIKAYPNMQDVLVHVDAFDDSDMESLSYISREDLKVLVDPVLAKTNDLFEKTRIGMHHLKGKNIVDIYLRTDKTKTIAEIEITLGEVKAELLRSSHIDGVNLYLDIDGEAE